MLARHLASRPDSEISRSGSLASPARTSGAHLGVAMFGLAALAFGALAAHAQGEPPALAPELEL